MILRPMRPATDGRAQATVRTDFAAGPLRFDEGRGPCAATSSHDMSARRLEGGNDFRMAPEGAPLGVMAKESPGIASQNLAAK
jgi:hypothetical protein